MSELRVLIAAAGRGMRAGLSYPKTLYPVQGTPILVRLHRVLGEIDHCPSVIVSPAGLTAIADCLATRGLAANLIVQSEARGMGDAVLQFVSSPAYEEAHDVLLVWGDIPFIQPKTVAAVVAEHQKTRNDMTFATRLVDSAYTIVTRDARGDVVRVTETRETGAAEPGAGEREIGLFVFRKQPVFDLLRQNLPGKLSRKTGEHGFLYVIEHLVARGGRVLGIPVAEELDLISLNAITDLGDFR